MGCRPGELGTRRFDFAGGPAVAGKTALALQTTWHTAETGRGAAFCSVEMVPATIGARALAQHLGWSLDDLRAQLTAPAVARSAQKLAQWPWRCIQWPWHVVDASGASVADLQAAVARADLTGPRCDVVFVDYLQLVPPSTKVQSREQEISRVGAELKQWARRDHRLVVVLSQMSQKVEERAVLLPTLEDLREWGALEQVADAVVFIHHHADSDSADLIVAKNRNGPTGSRLCAGTRRPCGLCPGDWETSFSNSAALIKLVHHGVNPASPTRSHFQ